MDTFELRDLMYEIDALARSLIGTQYEKQGATLRASAALKLGPLVAGPSPIPETLAEAIAEHE